MRCYILALVAFCFTFACSKTDTRRMGSSARAGKADGAVVVYSSRYQIKVGGIERLHPFDIGKYERIYEALVKEGAISPENVLVPDEVTEEQILRVHTRNFLDSLQDSKTVSRYLEAPVAALIPNKMLEARVLRPFRVASGGTLLAAREAMESGVAINIGGGYHHAKPDAGEGFCVYADVPIAIRQLQSEGLVGRALIIDLDVHQGNGTIVCLADDPSTYTFSMHQEGIYPVPKEVGDEDVAVPSGMEDEAYLAILEAKLAGLFRRSGSPDIVFYVAGCDTLAGDPLASLAMTHAGIARRDKMVIDACRQRATPVVMTLSGGYSDDAWSAQFKSIRAIIASPRESEQR